MAKNMRILCCLCALLALASSALASPVPEEKGYAAVYTVEEAEIRVDALLEMTFDGNVEIEESRRNQNILFWNLKDSTSYPFCQIGALYGQSPGIQNSFSIARHWDTGEEHIYHYNLDSWNTIAEKSGFSAPRAEETIQEGLRLMGKLELSGAQPLFFSTLGRMEGTTESRKVVFRQTLNGLPLHWCYQAFSIELEKTPFAEGCYAEWIFSDEDGLLHAQGSWCKFSPESYVQEIITQEEAAMLFEAAGFKNSAPEACYFLSFRENGAIATLAWRNENSYLSALDGSWLQVGK